MNSELLQRLRSLKKAEQRITPDAAWVKATRAMLVMQVQNTLPAANTVSFWKRLRATFQTFAPRNIGTWMHRPMIAAMSLIAVLMGGSIMSVSAAEQALPGEFLYNLKLATEQARLAFTPVRSEKLQLKTEFTTRRVDELKRVVDDSEHPDRVVVVAEILKRDLDTLKQQLDDVAVNTPATEAVAAAKLVDQKTTEVMSALQDAKAQLSPEGAEKVTEAQSAAADTSIKAIEVLVVQHEQSSDVIPAEEVAQAIQDHAKAVTEATSSTTLTIITETSATTTSSASVTLANIATSSTLASSTSSLSIIVKQMKDATTQAFDQQKAINSLATTADATSTTMISGTSTVSIPTTTSSTQTSTNPGTASTSSRATTSTSSTQ